MSWEIVRPHIHKKWKSYWYQTHPPGIAAESWEYLFSGGKEIRARLFCELWSYLSPDVEPCGELAFAIECIHAASLILDDTPWMDNAATRRGRPTLHLTYSNKKALMICHDVMYMVYLIWNKNKPVHVPASEWEHFIMYHLQRLMMGQAYDLEKKGTLVELASMKTGVLFELVAETVAICTHLDTNVWRLWGNHLGILFQWMDDWQDREEDTLQQNRNAFNEAYTVTLSYYGQIWERVEQVIGPTWFHRPFGAFMKTYFTSGIPLPSTSTSLPSLSHLFLSYPTPTLPTLPDIDSYEKQDVLSITRDPNCIIRINKRNIFDLSPSDIEQLLRSKQPMEVTINNQINVQIDLYDLFHLELMQWIQTFNENNIMKMNGKQIIRIMLRVVKRFEQTPKNETNSNHNMYESWKQKIWAVEETEWEYQPELINFIYHEIQLMKNRQGVLDS
jgi:hypothetical protein